MSSTYDQKVILNNWVGLLRGEGVRDTPSPPSHLELPRCVKITNLKRKFERHAKTIAHTKEL